MIRVESPGLLDTVQDGGRRGWQHLGVGVGGAADELSHALANLLAGNPGDAAALEFTLRGPDLRFETEALVAFAGAPFPLQLEDRPAPRWSPFLVRAGERLRIGKATRGLRGYLALAGGLQVPAVLGSAATDLRGGFGGIEGRPLRAGDALPFPHFSGPEPTGWRLPWSGPLPEGPPERPLRLVPGPQWDCLTADSQRDFLATDFRVDGRSDRMGLRLDGPALALERPLEMVSAGVATGTLQLPPDGAPILLLADRQTTGGYPRLGEVATADLPWAAQARPGDRLRFALCSVEEAQRAGLAQQRKLRWLAQLLAKERA